MRIDLAMANGYELALPVVRTAPLLEEMGFDGLWMSEHVISTAEYSKRDYGPYWLETLSTLAHLAGITKKIRLGTSIMVAPYRNPVIMAKTVATIDQLSGGRVDLGVGTGWSLEEFMALGLAHWYSERGALTNEVLEVALACWQGGDKVSWEGKYFKFKDIVFQPRPAQAKLPLWVGGNKPVPGPLRRIARFADVWHASQLKPEKLKAMGDQIDEFAGRTVPRSTRLPIAKGTSLSEVCDKIVAHRDVGGCMQVRVDFRTTDLADFMGCCEALATQLSALRA